MSQTNNKEDIRAYLYFAVFFAVAAFVFGYRLSNRTEPTELVRTDTLVVVKWDTVTIEKPTERIRYIVRYDTLNNSDLVNITDSTCKETADSCTNVIIPIEQAVYSDSTETAAYTAYISGFHAALDSINIFCKNTETTITNTERVKNSRLGVGIQLGVGVSPQGLAVPYLGVGVQYRLWPNR